MAERVPFIKQKQKQNDEFYLPFKTKNIEDGF